MNLKKDCKKSWKREMQTLDIYWKLQVLSFSKLFYNCIFPFRLYLSSTYFLFNLFPTIYSPLFLSYISQIPIHFLSLSICVFLTDFFLSFFLWYLFQILYGCKTEVNLAMPAIWNIFITTPNSLLLLSIYKPKQKLHLIPPGWKHLFYFINPFLHCFKHSESSQMFLTQKYKTICPSHISCTFLYVYIFLYRQSNKKNFHFYSFNSVFQ